MNVHVQDPSKRWSCEQLLKHAFFKNFSVKLPEDEEVQYMCGYILYLEGSGCAARTRKTR
jgi:hypothetical protein